MKHLRLVWRNATRNRVRAALTAGGSALLIFVVVFLSTAVTELHAWQEGAVLQRRVVVQSVAGGAVPLPVGLESFLRGPEVAAHAECVQKLTWGAAYWQHEEDWFPVFAVDPEPWTEMWRELSLPPGAQQRFSAARDAAIVGASLARRFGWREGQRVALTGAFHPCHPELVIAGIYTAADGRDEERLWFRFDYFDELMGRRGAVGSWWLRARTDADIPKLKEIIDARTRNSSDPTETVTEREYAAQFVQMMGNLKGLVAAAASVVAGILVLMTANTMAMSARERVTEVAVMRTLGFPGARIVALFVAESVVLTTGGASVALGASLVAFNVLRLSPAPQFFPYFKVEPATAAMAIAIGLACGVLSAAVPAIRASRRTIVDGLRQVV
jgi:putative ABC transport system permease protein